MNECICLFSNLLVLNMNHHLSIIPRYHLHKLEKFTAEFFCLLHTRNLDLNLFPGQYRLHLFGRENDNFQLDPYKFFECDINIWDRINIIEERPSVF